MAKKATGQLISKHGKHYARVRTSANVRRAFLLSAVAREDEARARVDVLAGLAAQLRTIGQPDLAVELLEAGAAAREGDELDEVIDTVRRLVAGELRIKPTSTMTFKQLGEMWTSGQLAERWPDHIKRKRERNGAATDRQRLERHVYPLVGRVRLVDFTLSHAELVMRSLPPGLERATRRQYAQLVSRVLSLAAYPCRIIDASPIPRGFLPKLGPAKARSFLYPDEDRQLLACAAVPFGHRVLYGFASREGMRKGELEALSWRDLDLERGRLRLDRNKTDTPRAWALDPGVARALRALYALRGEPGPDALVFVDEAGEALPRLSHLARTFRAHLRLAGVDRAELFERSEQRIPIVAHDLRATFITIALACGRTETWVADRTGHTSSVMINRYRRAARSLSELGIGELAPLDQALPELAPFLEAPAPAASAEGEDEALGAPEGDRAPNGHQALEAPSRGRNEQRRNPEGSRRFAEERTRTSTTFRPLEPESSASASSATSAWAAGCTRRAGGCQASGGSEIFS